MVFHRFTFQWNIYVLRNKFIKVKMCQYWPNPSGQCPFVVSIQPFYLYPSHLHNHALDVFTRFHLLALEGSQRSVQGAQTNLPLAIRTKVIQYDMVSEASHIDLFTIVSPRAKLHMAALLVKGVISYKSSNNRGWSSRFPVPQVGFNWRYWLHCQWLYRPLSWISCFQWQNLKI